MDIVPTNVGGAAIAVQPPHPHGALLLADYLLGPEGQTVLDKYEYGSAAKNLGFKQWRPDHGISTDKYEKELERWEKLASRHSAAKARDYSGRDSFTNPLRKIPHIRSEWE